LINDHIFKVARPFFPYFPCFIRVDPWLLLSACFVYFVTSWFLPPWDPAPPSLRFDRIHVELLSLPAVEPIERRLNLAPQVRQLLAAVAKQAHSRHEDVIGRMVLTGGQFLLKQGLQFT